MHRPLRILLVEDSEADAILLEREIRRSGYSPIVERVDTSEAMTAALDGQIWDVLIADYRLPRFSALAALALMKERDVDLPVIIVSGAVSEETAVEAMRAGAHDFVVKGSWARLGPAIEREILDAANRRECRRADETWRFLADASKALAVPLDVEAPLRNVAGLLVPFLGDACAIDLIAAPGKMERVIITATDPAKEELLQQDRDSVHRDWNPMLLSGQIARDGESVFVPDLTESHVDTDAPEAAHIATIQRLGVRSYMAVPMLVQGRSLGVISLAMVDSGRQYGPSDLALAKEVAARCALVLDNARLYREAKEQAAIQAKLNFALREAIDAREEALRREQSARVEAEAAVQLRDEFLSIAAHELRTPIAGLRAIAQLEVRRIERRGELDSRRITRSLEMIDLQTAKLATLISRLLDVSRIEAGSLVLETMRTDVAALVYDVAETAQARTDRHRVEIVATADISAQVDPIRLEQVLVNLVDNAIRYSPSGGTVEVAVSRPVPDEVRISVTDQGIGIPEEKRARIFDRYFRAHVDEHIDGMGLGLFVSQQIVNLHGGRVVAEFPPTGGTRFVVILPIK